MSQKLHPEHNDEMVKRLGRVGAFAPGSYVSQCVACKVAFVGDKRALKCLPCAVSTLMALARHQGQDEAKSASVDLPQDVIDLVIAARKVSFDGVVQADGDDGHAALSELDKASEAFASRVPWENEPSAVKGFGAGQAGAASTKTGDVTIEEVAAIIADNRPARSALRKAELIVKLFEAGHAALEENLRRRDDFIVSRGQRSEFVDQLPASGKAPA